MAKPVELDIPGALRRVGGDRELLARVIDFVVEDSPQLMQRIVAALDAERFREVERAAHSLNGLVSNVHCIAVQEKVLEVEDLRGTETAKRSPPFSSRWASSSIA